MGRIKTLFNLISTDPEIILFQTLLYFKELNKKEEYKKLCSEYHNQVMNSIIDNLKLDLKKLNDREDNCLGRN